MLLRATLRYYIFTNNKAMMFLFYHIVGRFSKCWSWRACLFIKRFRQDAFREPDKSRRIAQCTFPHCNATNEHDCDKSLLITDLYLTFLYRYRIVPWYLIYRISAHPWSSSCSHKQSCAIRTGVLNLYQTRTCFCVLPKSISARGIMDLSMLHLQYLSFSELDVPRNLPLVN